MTTPVAPRVLGPANGPKQILGRDPAAILAFVQALLTLLLAFGALEAVGLKTQNDLLLVLAVVGGLSALYLAWGTTETVLAAVVELFKAGVACATIWGLDLGVEREGLAIILINATFTAFLRTQTSPLARGSFATIQPDDVVTPRAA